MRKLISQQGLLISLLGIVIVFASLCWGAKPTASLTDLGQQFIQTIGITLFAFGLFNIIVNSKSWRQYFEDRLRAIVMDNDYLVTLDEPKLRTLQTDVMKAFFRNQDIDKENSFLHYFHQNLHGYISEPYREDVSTEVILKREEGDCFLCFDRVSYACRKGGESIQKSVQWKADRDEFQSVLSLKIEVKYPSIHEKRGRVESLCDMCESDLCGQDEEIAVDKSLEKFKNVDGLVVTVTSQYLVKKHRFQYWEMAHPTKNFAITIKQHYWVTSNIKT